jgi:hypothetical protein
VAAEQAGKPVQLRIVKLEATGENSGPSQLPEVSTKKELINRLKKETPVKAFLDTFDGEITDIKKMGNGD